jgi:anti-sigma B factor antagonist
MKISKHERGGVTILTLDGRLSIGQGDIALRKAVSSLLEEGETNILLDLKGVTSMDSSGLGELVSSKTTANAKGAQIKLLHLEGKVQRVVVMTRLVGTFESFDDEIDAIASFSNS